MFLYEVPSNIKNMQDDETNVIQQFWDREIQKCQFNKEQRVTKKEEWLEQQKQIEIQKAAEEAAKDTMEDVELQKELQWEAQY